MQRLRQQDLGVSHGVSDRVVFLLPREGELRERRLVAGRVLDVDEVLVIRDAVVLWQLEQTDEGLEQRGPQHTHTQLLASQQSAAPH